MIWYIKIQIYCNYLHAVHRTVVKDVKSEEKRDQHGREDEQHKPRTPRHDERCTLRWYRMQPYWPHGRLRCTSVQKSSGNEAVDSGE